MTFESIRANDHPKRYPGLMLGFEALRAAPGLCAVLNAANEVAVAAFLDRRIRFDQIHALNLETLSRVQPAQPETLMDLLTLDAQARACAEQVASRLQ